MRTYPATVALSFVVFVWATVPYVIWKFEDGAQGANITSYADSLWYGIVTMLTIGYGDRFAVTPGGRLVASFMMIIGVLGMGIITAKISAIFLEKALRERRGLVDTDVLSGHFIVCGWKAEMSSLLRHIIASSGLPAEKIVLVNYVPDTDIDALHDNPLLRRIKVVRGPFFQIDVLKRAAPEKARKILILADATPNSDGHIPTRTEADARTIMTAMTLANIAKGVPVAAEILDNNMDQYLRLAQVHEVIHSRDYSRFLLAHAASGTGVTNVFNDLLDPHSAHSISTTAIPAEAHAQTYGKLRELFQSTRKGESLIGILENSGNSHLAKEQALKKAQQTPNISKLVENLKTVKDLRFNKPVFNPGDDYVLPEGSMAIVIRTRDPHAGSGV